MSSHLDFLKIIWKTELLILAVVAILTFIPVGFGTLGMFFWGQMTEITIVFILAAGVYAVTQKLSMLGRGSLLTLGLLLLILSTGVAYADSNDLLVKQDLLTGDHLFGINNSYDYVFVSIDKCDAYLYSARRNACRSDKIVHEAESKKVDQEMFLSQNINLVSGQNLPAGNENYPYFPMGNISDVKIGDGAVAKYGDNATFTILSSTVDGKTDDSAPSRPIQGILSLETIKGDDFYSYRLGVIGMRVGGVRKVTFKTRMGYWLDRDTSIKGGQSATFTIELVSTAK